MKVSEAAQKLLMGELVVFPTETVYGLGALASNEQAVRKIFEVKGRPAKNPLILHIAENDQLQDLVSEISPAAKKLIEHFWPGPLTICFKKSKHVSDLVTAGLPTVCVRRPDHDLAQQLLTLVGQPVAAPSANLSGRPSTTTFSDAKSQLEKKGVFFLDGENSPLGLESTIVDCSGKKVKLLRPGVIAKNDLERILAEEIDDETIASDDRVTSPGQLLQHYAPAGELTVIFGNKQLRIKWISENIANPSEWVLGTFADEDTAIAKKYLMADTDSDLETYAAELYRFLNWCDREQAKKILLELPKSNHRLQASLLNRLEKASGKRIIEL